MSSPEQNPAAQHSPYPFEPNLPMNIIFCALFWATSLAHGFQLLRGKTWYFSSMFGVTQFEAMGYTFRILSFFPTIGPPGFFLIASQLMLLSGPVFFQDSMDSCYCKLVDFVSGERFSLVRTRRLSKFFKVGDLLSLLTLQVGSILSPMLVALLRKIGLILVVFGLASQIAWFLIFLVLLIRFDRGIFNNPTRASDDLLSRCKPRRYSWRVLLTVLHGTSVAVPIRAVFRLFLANNVGAIAGNETLFFFFDSLLVFVVLVTYNIVHPSYVFDGRPGAGAEELGSSIGLVNTGNAMDGSAYRSA